MLDLFYGAGLWLLALGGFLFIPLVWLGLFVFFRRLMRSFREPEPADAGEMAAFAEVYATQMPQLFCARSRNRWLSPTCSISMNPVAGGMLVGTLPSFLTALWILIGFSIEGNEGMGVHFASWPAWTVWLSVAAIWLSGTLSAGVMNSKAPLALRLFANLLFSLLLLLLAVPATQCCLALALIFF